MTTPAGAWVRPSVFLTSRCFQDYIDPDDTRADDDYVEPAEGPDTSESQTLKSD